ncbi:MAG: hypothetical protein IKI08_00935 [Selenomonadaceae bacterium]|nr:hypothetical protein [Selenomonadaceae bacterium]
MAIKFGEAEFAPLKKQEGEPVKIPILEVLPPWNPSPPRILPEEQRAQCFGYIQPMVAQFNQNFGVWEAVVNLPVNTEPSTPLQGENFIVNEKGLYQSKDGETTGKKISNASLVISKIERRWSGKKIREVFHVKVSCSDEQGTLTKTIKIPAHDFKKIFEVIRRELPSAYTSLGDLDAKEEYLTQVYQRDAPTAVVEYLSDIIGWFEFEGVPPKFYVGTDKFYADMNIVIPSIGYLNRREIFVEGSRFREIGHQNGVIEILWLVAHIALSLFWLRKFGVDFRSVIFVKGKTNLFKTTVVSLIANIFAKNRRKAGARLTSTRAYTQEFVTKLRDSVVLLDDFSNTVGSSNIQARDNAETAIRAVGDGMFSGKMNVTNLAEGRADDVQCVIVMTGEDELGLSESSLYRLIVLPIVEGTFDPQVLAYISNRHENLQAYFALFVQFIMECGSNVVGECASRFAEYRELYRQKFSVPRFIDAIATMAVEIDLIAAFGMYCGMSDAEMIAYREHALNAVENVMQQNLTCTKESKPEVRFLHALKQSIGTTKYNRLAATESEYVADSSGFIGFREKTTNTAWLRFDDAYKLVVSFYQRQSEQFLTTAKTIKELLLRRGLSDGKFVPNGQGSSEYLRKSKKPPRKWFLVLKVDAVEKYLEENQEEI